MPNNNTLSRRAAIAAVPLGIFGLTAIAKGKLTGDLTSTNNGVLDERGLAYALELITDASTSGIASSFVAFAQHLSTLAAAGDCEQIHAVAESLIDRLYQEHNHYGEARETWISEEVTEFGNVVDMDDPGASEAESIAALTRSRDQHVRRGGEFYEV
jgi:hypothetical protein